MTHIVAYYGDCNIYLLLRFYLYIEGKTGAVYFQKVTLTMVIKVLPSVPCADFASCSGA